MGRVATDVSFFQAYFLDGKNYKKPKRRARVARAPGSGGTAICLISLERVGVNRERSRQSGPEPRFFELSFWTYRGAFEKAQGFQNLCVGRNRRAKPNASAKTYSVHPTNPAWSKPGYDGSSWCCACCMLYFGFDLRVAPSRVTTEIEMGKSKSMQNSKNLLFVRALPLIYSSLTYCCTVLYRIAFVSFWGVKINSGD